MKRSQQKEKQKVLCAFRIEQSLNEKLEAIASKTRLKKTTIVEMALEKHLNEVP